MKVNQILFCIFLFEYSKHLRSFYLLYIWWIYIVASMVASLNIDFSQKYVCNISCKVVWVWELWIQIWSVYSITWFWVGHMTLGGLVFPFWKMQIISIALHMWLYVCKYRPTYLKGTGQIYCFYLCFVYAYIWIFLMYNFKSLYYDLI